MVAFLKGARAVVLRFVFTFVESLALLYLFSSDGWGSTVVLCCGVLLVLMLSAPYRLGQLLSWVITEYAMHGYPFKCGSLWILPVVKNGRVHIRLTAYDLGFANPPDYPHEWFLECKRLDTELSLLTASLWDLLLFRTEHVPLKKIPDFKCSAMLAVSYLELDGFMLNFELWEGKLNINEFTKRLANQEVVMSLTNRPRPMGTTISAFPNQLRVKVVRARNLRNQDALMFAKTTDPKVRVKCRDQAFNTATRFKTCHPMWNSACSDFVFNISDASAVLHVSVYNEDIAGVNALLGQWIMTLKYLYTDPKNNCHSELEILGAGWIRGWFLLMDKKWRSAGCCGEIQLEIKWSHSSATPPECTSLGALAQLKQNSTETKLRLGCKDKLKEKLNSVPVLFDIQRVTFRNIDVYMRDIFMGVQGHAEKLHREGKSVDKADSVKIDIIDWKKAFRPKYGDPGITCYKVVQRFFFKGLMSQIFDSKILGSALTHSTSGLASNLSGSLLALGKDLDFFQGINTLGKRLGSELKIVGSHVKGRIRTEAKRPGKRVNAQDDEFLLSECLCEGFLDKASSSAKTKGEYPHVRSDGLTFKRCYFQLKGSVLFYSPKANSEPRKIPLATIDIAIYVEAHDEIQLFQQKKVTVLRLCGTKSEDWVRSASNKISKTLSLRKQNSVLESKAADTDAILPIKNPYAASARVWFDTIISHQVKFLIISNKGCDS